MSKSTVDEEVEQLKSEIEAFRNREDYDPSSLVQSMLLSGLHSRLCSALMQQAIDRGKDELALKWSRECQIWSQQRSRDAKLTRVDLLRQLQDRVDLRDTRRRDFTDTAKSRRNKRLDS